MEKIRPLEAVKLAREELGERTPEELAAHIASSFGLSIKPEMVKVLLGSLKERDTLRLNAERARGVAAQETPQAKVKRQRRQGPRDGGTSTAVDLREPKSCPSCQGSYTFRGRKLVRPDPEAGELVETKYQCNACGCEWRVRVPAEAVGPLGVRREPRPE